MPITSKSLIRSTVALMLVGLLALAAIMASAFWLGIRTQSSFQDVLAARNLRSTTIDLRGSLQDVETSQRGYLLTGRDDYLAPYTAAVTVLPQQLDRLKQLLGNDAEVAESGTEVQEAIAGKLEEVAQTVLLKRAGKDADALAVVNNDSGKRLMDEARGDFATIIDVAEKRITAAVTAQQWSTTALGWVATIGSLIIALVVGGSIWAVLAYTRELSAARKEVTALNSGLEQRVRERTTDLVQANEEIQRFAYIVTHDLRAPLVNIMGFTAELETGVAQIRGYFDKHGEAVGDPAASEAKEAVDTDLPEAIGFIRSSTRKMDALINAILKLSREGGRVMRPEPVQLETLLEAAVGAIQHQVKDAEGEVSLELTRLPIVTDRLALEQVFGNLLDNAVKYRAPGRPLRIAVEARPTRHDQVEIKIADNGRGIAAQDHERVFELFRRSGVQDQAGEGIGLPYVRRVVKNLGGDIKMTSALGEGTTFTVTLPRAFTPLQEPKAK
ncbi:MAG TPA: ATP-binding protein [Devosiaceae bacterium]